MNTIGATEIAKQYVWVYIHAVRVRAHRRKKTSETRRKEARKRDHEQRECEKERKVWFWRGRWDVWDKERHVIRAHGALPWKP